MAKKKHIAIVGAGPGGLTSAMILARRGFDVSVFEKSDRVGGRNSEIVLGGYRFDVGPTFLMMNYILDEVFELAGKKSSDYLEFKKLEPMYLLRFDDRDVFPTTDREKMRDAISKLFPGNRSGLDRFHAEEKVRYEKMYPCLRVDYSNPASLLSPNLMRALPHLSLGRSLFSNLSRYFRDEKLVLSFTFQSKYLGMSAWECPAAFTLIPYVEHTYGIYHVTGGLCRISDAMAKVAGENGAKIHLKTPVRQVLVDGRTARGVALADGTKVAADAVVINQDFCHAVTHIAPEGSLKKYTPEKLRKMKFSCSTFMLYLGVKKQYDLPHHAIVFASDYRTNIRNIFTDLTLPQDMSFYIRNASATDPTIAPKGRSALYVLVPVPNNRSGIDWEKEKKPFRDRVIDAIIRRTGFKDLRENIEVEKVITPADWEREYSVYLGATFNLAHNIGQMLYFRPRNRFEEWKNCYLVGGGTHPGSGLPTIYESGRISADLISRDLA